MLSGQEKIERLHKALQYAGPTHRVSDIVELLKRGEAKLWENGDGCVITEWHNFPLFRAIHYWLVFGDLKQCLALDAQISEWAKGEGAAVATACGRRGWGRVAAPLGWREWMPNYVKRLAP